MSQPISLKDAERKVFITATNDGLWDILIGCFFLMFALAPLFSGSLGDFWSSVVFLPFWALVYGLILLTRKYAILPRIGSVKFGRVRINRLRKFSLTMLMINLLAFLAGLVVAVKGKGLPGLGITLMFGLILLTVFSFAAFLLGFTRLYLYGLLAALSPLVGEWLYRNANATHHGLPVTFGFTAGFVILVGLIIFIRLIRENPLPREDA
jgi:hypothetical protein